MWWPFGSQAGVVISLNSVIVQELSLTPLQPNLNFFLLVLWISSLIEIAFQQIAVVRCCSGKDSHYNNSLVLAGVTFSKCCQCYVTQTVISLKKRIWEWIVKLHTPAGGYPAPPP